MITWKKLIGDELLPDAIAAMGTVNGKTVFTVLRTPFRNKGWRYVAYDEETLKILSPLFRATVEEAIADVSK